MQLPNELLRGQKVLPLTTIPDKYPALDKIWYIPFLDIYNLHRAMSISGKCGGTPQTIGPAYTNVYRSHAGV